MKHISRLNNHSQKNKRALSNMVAYVILISITIALSVLVYNWLRFYVSEDDIPACPEGVNVIISDYECFSLDRLEVSIKNKGRFNIDGFALRVHNRTDATIGFYMLNNTGVPLDPGQEVRIVTSINFSMVPLAFEDLTLVEIQPYRMEEGKISCQSVATQQITCYS